MSKATKKEDKKEQSQQVQSQPEIKASQPEILDQTETLGAGKFDFPDGSLYEGEWKLVNGKKFKHGQGKIIIAGTLNSEFGIKEEYAGSWVDDRIEGEGIYKYKTGGVYTGEWLDNKQHGYVLIDNNQLQQKGKYVFPDHCVYEGQWVNHKMHGEGVFIDQDGTRWEGLQNYLIKQTLR